MMEIQYKKCKILQTAECDKKIDENDKINIY